MPDAKAYSSHFNSIAVNHPAAKKFHRNHLYTGWLPQFVIKNALSSAIYDELFRRYPYTNKINRCRSHINNNRYDIKTVVVIDDSRCLKATDHCSHPVDIPSYRGNGEITLRAKTELTDRFGK